MDVLADRLSFAFEHFLVAFEYIFFDDGNWETLVRFLLRSLARRVHFVANKQMINFIL